MKGIRTQKQRILLLTSYKSCCLSYYGGLEMTMATPSKKMLLHSPTATS